MQTIFTHAETADNFIVKLAETRQDNVASINIEMVEDTVTDFLHVFVTIEQLDLLEDAIKNFKQEISKSKNKVEVKIEQKFTEDD